MAQQRTIKRSASVEGKGLFSGVPSKITFMPAQAGSGVTFVRNDMPTRSQIPAEISNVGQRPRRTSLMSDIAVVETVEHVLSAVIGMGIDNLIIEVEGDETPSTDGSPLPFTQALQQAGIEEQNEDRKTFVIEEPVSVSAGEAMLAALPGPGDCLDILYDLDYSGTPSIGRQTLGFRLGKDDYVRDIAPARTFLLEEEAREFQARGMGKHLTTKDVLVMNQHGPIDNTLRFRDEHVRHKIADLIGDLALLGKSICGRVVAYKSGHELNHMLVRKLAEAMDGARRQRPPVAEPLMDIRKIMRILPHRYPFLMIDRIIEVDGEKRAVGIKNVTINEPFFQGHYPGQPIMPGVMIVEALAQLSGVLLSRRLEHTGKVAFLLSMDRVKMRRQVRPGDQLILEAETIHVRPRTGHCRCRAFLGNEIAAEAEIKFILVDAEPI